MTVDLDAMTAREMCAGLMRGDRLDMRRGYAYRSAALTAAEYKKLSPEEEKELLAWAKGWTNGAIEAIERADPATCLERVPVLGDEDLPVLIAEGYEEGRRESGFLLYPSVGGIS